jgi:hypothetical protein
MAKETDAGAVHVSHRDSAGAEVARPTITGGGQHAVPRKSDGSALAPAGAHANAWSAAAVGINGTSTALDTDYLPFVTAFGNSSAAATITLQVSQDNTNYYDGPTQVLAGAGNFCINATVGARYVRLKSSAAATITATLAAKG